MSSTNPKTRPQLDLRAVWLAAGAWISALLLTAASLDIATWTLLIGAICSTVSLWILFLNRGIVSWYATVWSPLTLALAGATTIAGVVTVQHQNVQNSPIMVLAEQSSSVRIQFTFQESPRAVRLNQRGGTEETDVIGSILENGNQEEKKNDSSSNSWLAMVSVTRFSSEGRWLSAQHTGTIVLTEKTVRGLDTESFSRGDTVEALAKITLADAGERSVIWVRPLVQLEPLESAEKSVFSGWVEGIRDTFTQNASALPGDAPGLLPGMVMGDRSSQSDALEQAMKDAGLAHLTAVSGANCSLILGFIALLLRSLRFPRWCVVLGCLVALVAFVLIVYPEPSVVRAAVMGSIAAVAVFAGRSRQALAALAVSVTVLLIYDPYYSNDPAFQLSVCATAGIVVIGRPLAALMGRVMPEWLAQALAVALAAQIACLPVLILLAPQFSTWSTIANIAVGPFVPFITVLGTLALLLGAISPMLPMPLMWIAGFLSACVGWIGRWFAELPFAVLEWPSGTPGAAVAIGITALLAVGLWNVHRPLLRTLLLVCSAAMLAAALVPLSRFVPTSIGEWDVAMCDVGQGDGFVIKTGEREAIVIDSGPEPELMDHCLKQLSIETIPLLFVTHLHADHAGGVSGVLRNRDVHKRYFSTSEESTNLKEHSFESLVQGVSGTSGNVTWKVLSPKERAPSENDASLVIYFKVSGWSFLTTGDIEADAMSALIKESPQHALEADVLKVSHHGARNGGTEILEVATPRLALISVGAGNSYGHPSPNIMEKLAALEIPSARTDVNGLVLLKIKSESELNYYSLKSGTSIE